MAVLPSLPSLNHLPLVSTTGTNATGPDAPVDPLIDFIDQSLLDEVLRILEEETELPPPEPPPEPLLEKNPPESLTYEVLRFLLESFLAGDKGMAITFDNAPCFDEDVLFKGLLALPQTSKASILKLKNMKADDRYKLVLENYPAFQSVLQSPWHQEKMVHLHNGQVQEESEESPEEIEERKNEFLEPKKNYLDDTKIDYELTLENRRTILQLMLPSVNRRPFSDIVPETYTGTFARHIQEEIETQKSLNEQIKQSFETEVPVKIKLLYCCATRFRNFLPAQRTDGTSLQENKNATTGSRVVENELQRVFLHPINDEDVELYKSNFVYPFKQFVHPLYGPMSSWNVHSIEDMSDLFSFSNYKPKLSKEDERVPINMVLKHPFCLKGIEHWKTPNLKRADRMFFNVRSQNEFPLQQMLLPPVFIDLSKWDTSNLVSMKEFIRYSGYSKKEDGSYYIKETYTIPLPLSVCPIIKNWTLDKMNVDGIENLFDKMRLSVEQKDVLSNSKIKKIKLKQWINSVEQGELFVDPNIKTLLIEAMKIIERGERVDDPNVKKILANAVKLKEKYGWEL